MRYPVGALLLFSATLKLHQLLTSPIVVSTDWLASPRVQWLAVGWESSLSLWLWSGWQGKWSRWAALSTFAVFAAVSLSDGVAGKRTCCCFGAVQAQPWLVFTLDAVVLIVLYRATPVWSACLARSPLKIILRFSAVGIITGGAAAAAIGTGPNPSVRIRDWPSTPLVVHANTQSEWGFWIENAAPFEIGFGVVESSCDCFRVTNDSKKLTTAGSTRFVAKLDLTRHREFVGPLEVVATLPILDGRPSRIKLSRSIVVVAMSQLEPKESTR